MVDKKTSTNPLAREQQHLQRPLGLKRPLSWLLFLPLLFAFFVLPLLAMNMPGLFDWLALPKNELAKPTQVNSASLPLNAHPSLQVDTQAKERRVTALALDSVWNPGPLASAHANLEGDCQACHAGNFSRVKDETCQVCHANMGLHVAEQTLPDTSFEEGRCASCHRDHKGRESLAEQNKHFVGSDCASCHQDIKAMAPNTATLPVADFAGDKHPAFRLTVANGPQTSDLRRIRMVANAKITESTGLKFPHDVHLDPKGVDGPKQKVVMKCSNCHEAADTQTGFKPLSMEAHCQDCHRLNFEPALPDRQVPHGSPELVTSTVEEFYSYLALNPSERNRVNAQRAVLRARPGEKEPNRSNLQALGGNPKTQAAFAVTELFENTACAVCHVVKPKPGLGNTKTSGSRMPQYTIAPLAPVHTWMPMAIFDHRAHAFESCESCHKASKSEEASDVLMPSIEGCQTCHAGSKPAMNKVRSDCGLCHEYHIHNALAPQHPPGNNRLEKAETQQ
ncbi:MAG TPA: cytochrome c3 family protein [Limnobacter sp.]|nr:cytochrome c3 family protein [Limnobacter sp.]